MSHDKKTPGYLERVRLAAHNHEPECDEYTRQVKCVCQCEAIRAAYRRGYNDHARAQQHWQDTHGAYRQGEQ